jgi:hypothetical protein
MLKHVVMFKMKENDQLTKERHTETLKEKLDELPGRVDVILKFETGLNIAASERAFDLVLVSEFKDENDLNIYKDHPDHQKVVVYLKEVCEETKVVDYLI